MTASEMFVPAITLLFLPLVFSGVNIYTDKTVKMEFHFTTCGAVGPEGPHQTLCDRYHKMAGKVKVLNDENFKGIQEWVVPTTALYGIHAYGASGGFGLNPKFVQRGAVVQAKMNLTAGEKIYILVGQKGHNSCEMCTSDAVETSKRIGPGGGGGGGGATYIFKMDSVTQRLVPLIIAGGGGGMAYNSSGLTSKNVNGSEEKEAGKNGFSNPQGAGGGGGWNDTTLLQQGGRSLVEGGRGGKACKDDGGNSWKTEGGFGGGGGACRGGGGGGGYTGGDAQLIDGFNSNGFSGTSFVHQSAVTTSITSGDADNQNYMDEGQVFFSIEKDCPCDFICDHLDIEKNVYECMCKVGEVLAADGHSCSKNTSINEEVQAHVTGRDPISMEEESLPVGYIVAICIACILIFICGAIITTCMVQHRKKKRHLKAVRLEMLTSVNCPHINHRSLAMHPGPRTNRMVTEYNPNYDFTISPHPEAELRELPRSHIKLLRPLGQGAFGEVFQGGLSNVPHHEGEMSVAVKTLPALSTEQAEMDFLMEAIIMSKFNHQNIVKCLGICFDMHPRYIVLELLAGGDLKNFLRESRPKADKPSPLCMRDLIKLAVDVAQGCEHLELNHFIHRDVAARNCLLTCKEPNRQAKIADFGMARDVYRSDYYKKGGKAMLPIKWMPPEAFLDGIFTSKTDVWSFGILLWEIFSLGYMPYPGRTNQDVMQFVTSGGRLDAPDKCPAPLFSIMSSCWVPLPEQRPTFEMIIGWLDHYSQDPEVLSAELPDCSLMMGLEKDIVQRPPDASPLISLHSPRVQQLSTSLRNVPSQIPTLNYQTVYSSDTALLDPIADKDEEVGGQNDELRVFLPPEEKSEQNNAACSVVPNSLSITQRVTSKTPLLMSTPTSPEHSQCFKDAQTSDHLLPYINVVARDDVSSTYLEPD